MPDLYEILGVTSEASIEDIKQAFRHRALECHPDISDSSASSKEFRKLVDAYEVITFLLAYLSVAPLEFSSGTYFLLLVRSFATHKNARNMTGSAKG